MNAAFAQKWPRLLRGLALALTHNYVVASNPYCHCKYLFLMNSHQPADGLAGKEWTLAPVSEVCLSILRAEWDKVSPVTSWHDRRLIDHPDLDNPYENSLRRLILGSWREALLRRIPGNTTWYRVRFLQDSDLDQLLVIGSNDWLDSRDQNELRQVALRRPQTLRSPPSAWEQPVLWSHIKAGPFSIIEGNNRLISYCSTPSLGPLKVECFIGLSLMPCAWHLPDQVPRIES